MEKIDFRSSFLFVLFMCLFSAVFGQDHNQDNQEVKTVKYQLDEKIYDGELHGEYVLFIGDRFDFIVMPETWYTINGEEQPVLIYCNTSTDTDGTIYSIYLILSDDRLILMAQSDYLEWLIKEKELSDATTPYMFRKIK